MYTCASTREVILDLFPDLGAEQCINSFRRYLSRRGVPQEIFTFISTMVQRFAAERNIKWTFHTPRAPGTSGFYERLVQSVKIMSETISRLS